MLWIPHVQYVKPGTITNHVGEAIFDSRILAGAGNDPAAGNERPIRVEDVNYANGIEKMGEEGKVRVKMDPGGIIS